MNPQTKQMSIWLALDRACAQEFTTHYNNCSGFVKAVARRLGVTELLLQGEAGRADGLVEIIRSDRKWTIYQIGSAAAEAYLLQRSFVVAGIRSFEQEPAQSQGHVAIISGKGKDPWGREVPVACSGSTWKRPDGQGWANRAITEQFLPADLKAGRVNFAGLDFARYHLGRQQGSA